MLALQLAALLFSAPSIAGSAIFKWPDPLIDYVDEALWGTSVFLPGLVQDCNVRGNTTISAQWVRIAYHDMATHNVDDGTGGLDGSILYELDRPQNVGSGMLASLVDFTLFTTPHVGFADLIAMGTVFAVAGCGGPVIPYRAGRIDAKGPGPATVPEPQQDLASHTESFRRQGFTQAEMIALVACGHALGGVRQVDFPEIVPSSVEFANFTPEVTFSNLVVKQYLDGTTQNPLVVGANSTTNSDLRIFSSDGNATMHSLSTKEGFDNTCKPLLERMINTVPKEVKLTEPVEPLDHKLTGFQLFPRNGSLQLNGRLRFIHLNPNRTVKIFWKGDNESACPAEGCSVPARGSFQAGTSFLGPKVGLNFTVFSFSAQVALNTSISKFWFESDEDDGSAPVRIDNGGDGYLVDDTVLLDAGRTDIVGSNWVIVVAVKNPITTSTKVSFESYQPGNAPTFTPEIKTVDLIPDPNHPPTDGYTFFTGNASTSIHGITIKARAQDKDYDTFVRSINFQA